MLDHTATSTDIALRTYRPDPFPEVLDIPRDTSARDMLIRLSAQELHRQAQDRLTERRWGNRFSKMWTEYHARNAPFYMPIALLAVVFAGAVLKILVGV